VFLKACVLLRAPGDKLHHNVSKLQDRYCELYPEMKAAFHIETPWDISIEDMGVDVEDYEHHTDQVFTYMSGKNLSSPKSIHFFSPGMCLFMCERFETDMARAWSAVREVLKASPK